jgi:hypothetical protein
MGSEQAAHRRTDMLRLKGFACAMLTTALILAATATAGAGGGGLGSGITSILFDCYLIHNGPDSPFTLSVNDQFGTHQGVRLGKARLLCAPTVPDANGNGAVVEHGPVLNGNFDAFAADHLKCYDVNPPVGSPATTVRLNDVLSDETVVLEQLSVLCSPATKEVIQP